MEATNRETVGEEQGQEPKKAGKVKVYINNNFLLLFAGSAISIMGDVLFDTTLSLWVALEIAKNQPWAPAAAGGVLVAAAIPTLFFGSLAGVFVDRWVKRTTMLRMDVIRAVLMVCLLLISGWLPLPFEIPVIARLGIIYTLVFLTSICSQFFNPSSFALIGDIVPDEYRARASGIEQATSGLANIIMPPVAVVLFTVLGVQAAISLNAISFVLSFLAILAIRPPQATTSLKEGQKADFLREYFAGMALIAKNKILLVALFGAFLAVISEGAQSSMGIFFFRSNLHAPIDLFGLVGSASGIGAIAGAILAAVFAQRLGITRVFSGALLLVGILAMVYARTTALPPALLCIFLIGLLVAAVNVVVGPIALCVTPKEMLGRVAATATSTLSLGSLLSIAILTTLASTVLSHFHVEVAGFAFGTYDTIFAFAGLIALLGGLFALRYFWNLKLAMPADEDQEVVEGQEAGAGEPMKVSSDV